MAVMLGVDIGGTKIAVGAVEPDGRLRGEILEYPSRKDDTETLITGLLRCLVEARDALAPDALGVGAGSAGTIDWDRGRVIASPNLPLVDYPLAESIGSALRLPVALDNDANVATLAEVRVGAARGFHHVIMLTLGTGVGGGIVLGGRVYRGATGSAGELGHTIVRSDGELCPCGRYGCLEVYASGTALERFARSIAAGQDLRSSTDRSSAAQVVDEEYGRRLRRLLEREELTGEGVGRLAREGDPASRDAVGFVAEWLGVGLANLANVFNPDMIVIGGGLGTLGGLLLDPAREVMRSSAIYPNGDVAKVSSARLGNRAGVVGAGLVAWEELERDGGRDG